MRRLAVVAAAVVLMSCAPSSVPAMRITRSSAVQENHYPAFDRSIDDAAAVRRVSDAVRALPPAPQGRSCPASLGLRYRLSFNEAARVVLSVVVEGDGCAQVIFTEADRRATDDAFWGLLAESLGVKPADIYNVRPAEVTR
ncbi:MAG: hypothetical protein ABJB39_08245 [Chloroflexota bacterium]